MREQTKKLLAPIIALAFALISLLAGPAESLYAASTTPSTINYQGRLLDNSSNPLGGAYTFRFSLWSSADWVGGDTLVGGGINTGSANYASWQETHAVTTDTFGLFNINLGSTTALPNFAAGTHDFLQVEVKVTGALDTTYEILDPQGSTADAVDRKTIHEEAYAENADTIDNADIGTAAGDLAVLGAGGVWDIARIPAGTNADIFQIDANDNAAGGIVQLSFASALNNHILSYDPNGIALGDGWFDFSDDVNVTGNLTTTGTLNGVNLSSIPFANMGTRNKTDNLKPHFPGAVAEALGGGSHKGKIETRFVDADGAGGPDNFSYYNWTTKQVATNDYDIVLRWRLPDDFDSWQGAPIVFRYKTQTAVLADNDIDITIDDTTGTNIGALTGASNLVNSSWTTSSIGFGGGGTFTAGSEITIYIKMNATNVGGVFVGDFAFNYVGR